MASLPGKNAGLWCGAGPTKVAGIASVKFGSTAKEVDVSDFDSAGFEEYLVGLIGGGVTASGSYESADASGQVALRTSFLAGTAIACEVRWTATTPKVAFSGLVTSFNIDASVTDKIGVEITIKPTGTLTFT
jgi:predicted secreted protein